MPVRIPDDAPIRAKMRVDDFDWDAWLTPGQRVEFHKDTDFPDSTMENFRQALRNAMGRRGFKGRYHTLKIDEDTFELVWKNT